MQTVRVRAVVARRRVLAGVVAVSLVTLAACGGQPGPGGDQTGVAAGADQEEPGPPRRGGSIVYGLEADPNGLDPTRNAFDLVGLQVANALYDPVAAFDAHGRPQPYLARAIEPVAGTGFRQWRILLRPGIRFHSGRALDAAAAKVFVEAITGQYVDPATGAKRASLTEEPARYIAGAEVVNHLELVVTMHKPWSTFPALLTGQGGYLISPDQIADPEGHSRPDGTGPFRLRSWEQGRGLSLSRNPDYWRSGLPYLDSIEFSVVADDDLRIDRLRSGELDVMAASSPAEVARLESLVAAGADGTPRLRLERDSSSSESELVMLNTARAPLDSDIVRQALAHATDVESLARDHGWDADRIVTGPFPPSSRWYAPTDPPRFDLARARMLVEEYKRRKGVDSISFELVGSDHAALIHQLRDQWARAGIDVTVTTTDQRRSVIQAVGGFYDAIQLRYFAAVDPDVLHHFWLSETRRDVGQISINMSRYTNPTVDAALERSRTTLDETTRREAYAVVQSEFARAVPYLWLFRSEWVVARSSRVQQARNITLPDGVPALAFDTGTHRLVETWVSAG